MVQSDAIRQFPEPGVRRLHFAGDTVTFHLTVPEEWEGQAWLRTSLGHCRSVRREIIRQVDRQENPLGRSWYDVPMTRGEKGRFSITVVLTEVGHFEAKGYFLKPDSSDPLWPKGDNTAINVMPADACCANIIYNAFVRQFGPNKRGGLESVDRRVKDLDETGFTVIPPSGTFRDLIGELDFIIDHLGCRILQLLPIHPTPTTYARMGRFGSPYAALSFTAVDPALAEFDPKATPLEQFIELVDAVHAKGARLFIDIAINHTGWAASLHETHPQWLSREPDGQIENPGAWGVIWADLTRLDYSHWELWQYMADVFLTWCRRGVDGFRCDAGYMIPAAAWRYMIAKVRDQFPNVIFLLEGLGGKISVTRDLLNRADFNWAYSELFQNYDRGQIEHYLSGAMEISRADGTAIHFAETHDNLRLAATSATWARMRCALCALLSEQGGFGFANGVEWLATEKINVHDSPSLNWGAEENQVDHIRRLNALLSVHPAFFHPVAVEMIQHGPGNVICAARRFKPHGKGLLVVVNLDADAPAEAGWVKKRSPLGFDSVMDLITGAKVTVKDDGDISNVSLEPGQVLCLTDDPGELTPVIETQKRFLRHPQRSRRQRLRAKVLSVWQVLPGCGGPGIVGCGWGGRSTAGLAAGILQVDESGRRYSASRLVAVSRGPQAGGDGASGPFSPGADRPSVSGGRRGKLDGPGSGRKLYRYEGRFLRSLLTASAARSTQAEDFKTVHLRPQGCRSPRSPLAPPDHGPSRSGEKDLHPAAKAPFHHTHVGHQQEGWMCRAHAHWNRLVSRYDALLAANLSPSVPEDRRILLTRMRGWVVYQGFSQQIGPDCLDVFGFDFDGWASWQYHIPSGQGQHVVLRVGIRMIHGKTPSRWCFTVIRPMGRRTVWPTTGR